MATTNHPKTFADLYTALLNNVRADSSVTAIVSEAKRMINSSLHDMHISNGEHFPWAHRRSNLVTQPKYEVGTITVTQGATTATGTSTLWNTNNAFGVANVRVGGKLSVAGSPNVHEITVVTDDTNLTFTPLFVDADVSAESYTYFEDEYALASDFLRPLDLRFFNADRTIELIGEGKFRATFPRNNITGKPIVASIFDKAFSGSAAPRRRVLLHRPPDEAYIIPYTYVTANLGVTSAGAEQTELSSDTDEPIVPLRYRMAIVHKAAAQWYLERRNDVQRSTANEALYQNTLGKLVTDIEVGGDLPQIRPRRAAYVRKAERPYSPGRSRYTSGTAFDEMRD